MAHEAAFGTTIQNLVTTGEHAGLSVDHIIELLQAGLSVGALLDLIELRLAPSVPTRRVM